MNKVEVDKVRRGYTIYESSLLGPIGIVVCEKGVEAIFLKEDGFKAYQKINPDLERDEMLCGEAKKQIEEYFKGERQVFQLDLVVEGTTFQKKVWEGLKQIPYGETISYKELAERIGNPKAQRAVGGANGANPIPLIVPCHRVIGKNGKMVGFMGNQIGIKEKLLAHELKYKS